MIRWRDFPLPSRNPQAIEDNGRGRHASISPVVLGQPDKILVHRLVELLAQKVGPEAEEGVHLLRVAGALGGPLLEAALEPLLVLDLLEPVVLEQAVRGVLELGQVERTDHAAWGRA